MSLLTVTETAAYLRVSESTVYRLTSAGSLPSLRIGGSIRFRQADLDHLDSAAPIPKCKAPQPRGQVVYPKSNQEGRGINMDLDRRLDARRNKHAG